MPEATALIPLPPDPRDEDEDLGDCVLVPFRLNDKKYRHPDRRYLVWFTGDGQPRCKEVPGDASVVSGSDPVSVRTFLREFVDLDCIPGAFEILSQRINYLLKAGIVEASQYWPNTVKKETGSGARS